MAPGGGVPPPWRMYSPRCRAYSSAVSPSSFAFSPVADWKYFLRNGTHQPQPVPAPPHSLIWLATRG